ncbi:MAG: ATP-binding protein [Thermoprotei archaeon]
MEYYPRKIEGELDKWFGRREVILIRGPRQSGKTTLLLHLREEKGGVYVTLEDEDALKTFNDAPKEFAKRYVVSGGRQTLYLDEVQYSKRAGGNLKLLYDLYSDSLKIVATGSGSFDVKVNVGGSLVGRAVYLELLPLVFEEFLAWKAKDLYTLHVEWKRQVKEFILKHETPKFSPAFQKEFQHLLEEFVVYGGYPAIVKEEREDIKKELLSNLIRTYLEKDVFFFFNVREMDKFRTLLSYLAASMGHILELSTTASDLHMDYRTLENYLSVLSNTYITQLVSPYHTNPLTELKKARKLYFYDTGLRNILLGNLLPLSNRTDTGILLENYVLNELREMGFNPKYWRTTTKAEVDFVLEADGQAIPVEVKTRGKEERGFAGFIKKYNPKSALVLTQGETDIKRLGETTVLYIPHYFI